MGKLERAIVWLFVGTACPLLTFVSFWWTAAFLHLNIPAIPLNAVIAAAFIGLGLGLLLDLFFLRRWSEKFYAIDVRLMATLYFALAPVALALFMGLPIGTFTLGIAAGVYIGRREKHARAKKDRADSHLRRTAVLVATSTALIALPIGLLALRDRHILEMLETTFGLEQEIFGGFIGAVTIGILCLILFALQYGCSAKAGRWAFSARRVPVRSQIP